MTDDIVTQLREIRWEWDKTWVDKMKDAADEIEYLRKERDRWAEFAVHIATCPNWGKRTCWDCVSPTNQDQAREAGLEETIRSEYGKR
jgi:hypothetical protein